MDRFRRMEIFVSVVETGQFTRAASVLNLSKSAVSHAINDLEKFLGLQLLTRNNRSLQLTDAGQSYYEQSARILSDVSELENKMRDSDKTVSGRIRLSAPLSNASYTLSPIINAFMVENPEVTVELVLSETYIDLIEEGIDFAVRFGDLKNSGLITRKISEASHVFCASPNFIKQNKGLKDLNALKNINCMKFTGNPIWRVSKDGRTYNFKPKGTLISNSGEALREFAIAGQGVAFLPGFLANDAIAEGRLKQILSKYKARPFDVSIVRPPGRHSTLRVRRLIDLMAKEVTAQ